MPDPSARVLVVDDEPDLRNVVAVYLRQAGYEVATAADGREALEHLRHHEADVVLLDLMMPGLSGFDVLERLNEGASPPVVIFLSAVHSLETRTDGLYRGAVDFITKPFEPEDVIARVAAAARQKARLDEARTASVQDALTGLGNRRAYDQALDSALARARRQSGRLALLLLDADGLKHVNDRFGHEAGDEFLRAVACAIRKTFRESDPAARIGGDEFAVLLADADRKRALPVLLRLEQSLAAETVQTGSGAFTPAVSIGIAVYPEDADNARDLQRCADESLYEAKARKREA